ncbi:MAG: class I SAM-dependent methyltransferase [Rhodospirillaceae bacterium]
MVGQAPHALLAEPSHDELSLQSYVSTLRMHILNDIGGGLRGVYDNSVKPAFESEKGRAPKDEHEVRRAMMKNGYCRTWSSMMRSCQEMIWDSIIPSIERAQPNLNTRAEKLAKKPRGSLILDPSLKPPPYTTACDIHLMPGNYHTERGGYDVSQGMLYDRGVYVYAAGNGGPLGDTIGRSMAEHLKIRFPDFKPKRILDIGCTVGHNLLPIADAYPDAEVHAIDVSAPILRYAHGRAESLDTAIHLHQMNGEDMSFESSSFDLVMSVVTFHETSRIAMKRILNECQRVLRPGGLMIHMELPRTAEMDPFDAFYIDWDAYYNNEPFYQAFTSTDMKQAYVAAGFDENKYMELMTPDIHVVPRKDFEEAAKASNQTAKRYGRLGESIHWTGWGAWK